MEAPRGSGDELLAYAWDSELDAEDDEDGTGPRADPYLDPYSLLPSRSVSFSRSTASWLPGCDGERGS